MYCDVLTWPVLGQVQKRAKAEKSGTAEVRAVCHSVCHSVCHLCVMKWGRKRKKAEKYDTQKIKKPCKSIIYKADECPGLDSFLIDIHSLKYL
jgi:hypothetical protein